MLRFYAEKKITCRLRIHSSFGKHSTLRFTASSSWCSHMGSTPPSRAQMLECAPKTILNCGHCCWFLRLIGIFGQILNLIAGIYSSLGRCLCGYRCCKLERSVSDWRSSPIWSSQLLVVSNLRRKCWSKNFIVWMNACLTRAEELVGNWDIVHRVTSVNAFFYQWLCCETIFRVGNRIGTCCF